jgi:hypothetical protein
MASKELRLRETPLRAAHTIIFLINLKKLNHIENIGSWNAQPATR